MSEHHWYIPCACGDLWHGLFLRQWPEEHACWVLTLVFHLEHYTFWQRLRLCWDTFRGKLEWHEIVLYREELEALQLACAEAQMWQSPVSTYGTARTAGEVKE